uniref:Polymerase (DNA directed), mu n=1 Tax=Poecilia latipinna TaxID=48699 RepID=A0A3B3VRW1_9TELE
MVPLKRRKVANSGTLNAGTHNSAATQPNKFPQVILFLLERKMGASRRAFLSQLGRRKGFQVEELFSKNVTHVICESNTAQEARMWLEAQGAGQAGRHLLDVSWYTESMRDGHPVEILDRHKLQDILENGTSSEVESTKESERFKALKVLTGIFGVGSKTADRWIREGIHNLQQLRDSGQTLNRAQQAGLEHYDDIKQPVSLAEAEAIRGIVGRAVASVSPEAQIVLTGGFRRSEISSFI